MSAPLQAYDPAAMAEAIENPGSSLRIPAVSPQRLGLALAIDSHAGAPAARSASASPSTFSNPQLLAAQLEAQNAQSALAQNNAGAANMKGGYGEFGARLLADALLQGQEKKAMLQLGQAQISRNAQLADLLHPGDQKFAALMAMDPQGALGAAVKGYEPMDVRQGNTVLNGPNGPSWQAPTNYDDGGVFGQYGSSVPGGVQTFGQRPMNYGEQTAQASQQAAQARSEAETAQGAQGLQLQQQGLRIQQQQANTAAVQAQASQAQAAAAAQQAATGAGNLNLNQNTSPTFALPQGYVLNGAH